MRARCSFLVTVPILTVTALTSLATRGAAVPAWSRSYEIPCTGCHQFPSLQLTTLGTEFLRRGHRMEGDKEQKDVTKLMAAHIEWTYATEQGHSTPFVSPEFHLHAGGPLSSSFSAYLDANVNSDFEAIYGQYTNPIGSDGYLTARAGKTIPVILREYAAGLMASASTPLIITDATLGQNPFTPTRDSYGVDAAGKWHALFVQIGAVSGNDVPGQALVNQHKDFFASAEVNLSDQPTGVGLYYFHGGYDLLADTLGTLAFDRYDRGAVFANLTRSHLRVAGALLVGQDHVEGQATEPRISGFYAQLDALPSAPVVPFARFDRATTENVADAASVNQATIGLSAAMYFTDVTGGRISLEFSRRDDGTATTNGGAVTLVLAF